VILQSTVLSLAGPHPPAAPAEPTAPSSATSPQYASAVAAERSVPVVPFVVPFAEQYRSVPALVLGVVGPVPHFPLASLEPLPSVVAIVVEPSVVPPPSAVSFLSSHPYPAASPAVLHPAAVVAAVATVVPVVERCAIVVLSAEPVVELDPFDVASAVSDVSIGVPVLVAPWCCPSLAATAHSVHQRVDWCFPKGVSPGLVFLDEGYEGGPQVPVDHPPLRSPVRQRHPPLILPYHSHDYRFLKMGLVQSQLLNLVGDHPKSPPRAPHLDGKRFSMESSYREGNDEHQIVGPGQAWGCKAFTSLPPTNTCLPLSPLLMVRALTPQGPRWT